MSRLELTFQGPLILAAPTARVKAHGFSSSGSLDTDILAMMPWTRDWLLSWKPRDICESPVTYKVAKCWISMFLFGWRPASTGTAFLWRSWKRETRSRKKKYGQGSHRETPRAARKVDKDWAGQTHSNRCCWQRGQGPDSWGSKIMLQFLWHPLWETGRGFLTPPRLPQEPLSTPPTPWGYLKPLSFLQPQVVVIIITLTIKCFLYAKGSSRLL